MKLVTRRLKRREEKRRDDEADDCQEIGCFFDAGKSNGVFYFLLFDLGTNDSLSG